MKVDMPLSASPGASATNSIALLSQLDANRYQLMHNVERQCQVEATWKRFERDIRSIESSRRSCLESATSTEERIKKMQSALRFGGGVGFIGNQTTPSFRAGKAIDIELGPGKTARKELYIHSTVCPSCRQNVLRELLSLHQLICGKREDQIISESQEVEMKAKEKERATADPSTNITKSRLPSALTPPQSPRNGAVSCGEQTMKKVDPTRREAVSKANVPETIIDASDESIGHHPDHAMKLSQYKFRIKALEKDIVDCQRSQVDLSERRAFVGLQLVRAQERILALNSEIDRVALFTGKDIISSVLHGSDQRFTVGELKRDLQAELQNVKRNIATWKAEIISGDEREGQLLKDSNTKEQRLDERRLALKAYEHKLRCADRIRLRLNAPDPLYAQNIIVKHCFQEWLKGTKRRKEIRRLLANTLDMVAIRSCATAFQRWLDVTKHEYSRDEQHHATHLQQDPIQFSGAGDALLFVAQEERHANARDVVAVMKDIADNATGTRETCPTTIQQFLSEADQSLLLKATLFYNSGQTEDSVRCYESLADNLAHDAYSDVSREAIAGLYCTLYGKIGWIQMQLKSFDVSLFYSDCRLKIAEEFHFGSDIVDALLCMGECYYAKEEQATAAAFFSKSLHSIGTYCDNTNQTSQNNQKDNEKAAAAAAYQGLEKCYADLGMESRADKSKADAARITHKRELQMAAATEKMDSLKNRLVNVTAETADVISLQRATPHYVQLKLEKRDVQLGIEMAKQEVVDVDVAIKELNMLLDKIIRQLEEARQTKSEKMISSLVHENAQEFDTAELIYRLELKKEEVLSVIRESAATRQRLLTRIKNQEDDLCGLDDDISIEKGPLVQRVLENNRIIRCMALSTSNAAGNDLMGGATGGVEYAVVSEGKDIYVHKLRNGKIKFVFHGDEEGKHAGEVVGHTCFVTCLYFFGTYVYSGSMDKSIMCWDVDSGNRVFTARGHEATITCINVDDAKIVSGSADMSLGVWNRKTGELLQRVNGHARGILSVQCGPSWCVSGDSDGVVFVWDYEDEKFQCRKRLRSLRSRITVVRYGELEVITGDSNGYISIWWIKTGKVLQRCKAHNGSVLDLQFDATKVVSCGFDETVQVVDILTGDVLQTLRGHDGPVLAVSFDSRSILSASRDGTLRRWAWGDPSARFEDKVHTFAAGEKLPDLSKRYGITVSDIVTWNGIRDAKLMYTGQKLIVKKGDPNARTKAEIKAERNEQREQIRESRMLMHCLKSDQKSSMDSNDKDDLVENLKVGISDDPSTFANRVIGKNNNERQSPTGTNRATDALKVSKGSSALSARLRR